MSFFAKEPLIIGLFCGKWLIKISHPMRLRHPVVYALHFYIHNPGTKFPKFGQIWDTFFIVYLWFDVCTKNPHIPSRYHMHCISIFTIMVQFSKNWTNSRYIFHCIYLILCMHQQLSHPVSLPCALHFYTNNHGTFFLKFWTNSRYIFHCI